MNVHIGLSLLGDTILTEPAMAAWSATHGGQRVNLRLDHANAAYECLFWNNPAINLIPSDGQFPDTSTPIVPNSSHAFTDAHVNNLPFAGGYFYQFGMQPNRAKDRLHYKIYGLKERQVFPYVCICPNARSCANTSNPAEPPSIKAMPSWWSPIVEFIRYGNPYGIPVFNLGATGDMQIEGTTAYHGFSLRSVADLLNNASLVISVETGLLHLSGGIAGLPVIFLSSATPPFLCCPVGGRVVRSRQNGIADFSQEETIEYIREILGCRNTETGSA